MPCALLYGVKSRNPVNFDSSIRHDIFCMKKIPSEKPRMAVGSGAPFKHRIPVECNASLISPPLEFPKLVGSNLPYPPRKRHRLKFHIYGLYFNISMHFIFNLCLTRGVMVSRYACRRLSPLLSSRRMRNTVRRASSESSNFELLSSKQSTTERFSKAAS